MGLELRATDRIGQCFEGWANIVGVFMGFVDNKI